MKNLEITGQSNGETLRVKVPDADSLSAQHGKGLFVSF
jgi:hypothetical protein